MDVPQAALIWDPVYLAFGAAILVGCLITITWRDSGGTSYLVIVPLIAAYLRFGFEAAPALVVGVVIANALHRATPIGTAAAAVLDVTAFAAACLVAAVAETPGTQTAVFAIVFALARVGLWWLVS